MRQFDFSCVKDPTCFAVNRLEAHSDHVCYADASEAASGETSRRYSLDGVWKFHYARNFAQTVPGYEKEDYDCKPWADIRVPAHIQMEGYDIPQYVNLQFPWDGREDIWTDDVPTAFNPVASYVKYFTLPEHFQGRPLYISFQGVESGMALWLNGQFVGYSEDSFTPSEFELTPYVREGENKLAVTVIKWTSGSWCEDQDFFRFSGIFRSVYLYTVPAAHVWDIKTEPLVMEDLTRAELALTLKTAGAGSVHIVLKDKDTALVDDTRELAQVTEASYEISAPKLWSAETPYLYDLIFEVYDKDGNLTEVIPQ